MNVRQSPRMARPQALTATAAAAVLALSGCGFFGGDDDDNATDEDRYLGMINESAALESELSEAENRYLRQCMTDQGFDVHDPYETVGWDFEEFEDLVEYYPGSDVMLTVEEAEDEAFGIWQMAPESDHAPEDETGEGFAEEEELHEQMEEFRNQGDSYEREYYSALLGEELAFYNYPHLDPDFEENTEVSEGDFILEEEPLPEGCRGDLADEVYDGGEVVTEEFDGEEYSYFTYRPEQPRLMDWEEKTDAFLSDSTIETHIEFEDCLAENGLDGWTFDEHGIIDPHMYFQEMYFGDDMFEGDGMYVGPDPDPSLTEYDDIRDHEFDVATQFAECNEETEAGEQLRQTWLDIELEELRELESDIVAWQEEMDEALDALQSLISE